MKQHELTPTEGLVSERPRLEPIETPKGLTLRFVYWMTRRRFGKVPASIKVVVARAPKILSVASAMGKYETKATHLEKELHYMINLSVAGTNECGFCLDIGRMMAVKDNMNMEKFNALPSYRTSSLFSERERAALAYAEEATIGKRVSDATFSELQKYYSDRDIVEITILMAIANFTNLTNIPLGVGSDGLCAIAQSRKK
ncbi:MAG: carboxymuconolactone decarboxylase family protein [Nitrososphaerales archaeon]